MVGRSMHSRHIPSSVQVCRVKGSLQALSHPTTPASLFRWTLTLTSEALQDFVPRGSFVHMDSRRLDFFPIVWARYLTAPPHFVSP